MIIAKKSLSQNFLIDKNIISKILNLTIIQNQNILEIGPGLGFMTDEILLKNPKKIYLIEKDFNLVKLLTEKYKNDKRVVVISEDILKYPLDKFENLIIISNLPYNISTKIILYLFNYKEKILEMICMLQKEVALKFNYNLPKMNKYKFYTKLASSYKICFNVSPKVFVPKPKVQSSVVKFSINNKKINFNRANNFENKIFKNVRKKIYKNLNINSSNNLLNKRVSELTIEELLYIYNFF